MKKRHYPELDAFKGACALLVVLAHVISQYPDSNRTLSIVFDVIYSFHMPAFILISGFCAAKILDFSSSADFWGFLRGRFLRLMVPYFVWAAIYTPLRIVMNDTARVPYVFADAWQIFLGYNPDGAMWFLCALFIGTVISCLGIRALGLGWSLGIACVLLFLVECGVIVTPSFLHFGYSHLFTVLFYFLLGILLNGAYDRLHASNGRIVFFLVFAFVFMIANVVRLSKALPWNCGILTGVSGSVVLWGLVIVLTRVFAVNSSLVALGGFAMEIYILAEPIKVGIRLLQGKSCSGALQSVCLMFFLVVVGAFVLAKVIHRMPLVATILFGTPRKVQSK